MVTLQALGTVSTATTLIMLQARQPTVFTMTVNPISGWAQRDLKRTAVTLGLRTFAATQLMEEHLALTALRPIHPPGWVAERLGLTLADIRGRN